MTRIRKWCCGCKQYKDTSEFHRNKSKPDSLASWCKTCRPINERSYQAHYYQAHRDTLLPRHRISALASLKRKKGEKHDTDS